MKKTVLQALLICLGIALLCGLYSFKTHMGEKSQRIKKDAVEYNLNDCVCTLRVDENVASSSWYLVVHVGCSSNCNVKVTYDYTISYADGTDVPGSGSGEYGYGDHVITSGSMRDSRCFPGNLHAYYVNN